MMGNELPVSFSCEGQCLLGILHCPEQPKPRGVLVIVGGPQTKVGSHRQFVLLARALASHGIPVFRFDYRGMGDSEGDSLGFEQIGADISAAVSVFASRVPSLREVVLWGLCDAASAAMMFASQIKAVRGMVLLNPWVRSDAGLAKAYLRHYYLARLGEKDYWRNVLKGRSDVLASIKSLIEMFRKAATGLSAGKGNASRAPLFTDRMRQGLEGFKGHVLVILSGRDLTAAEFKDALSTSPEWRRLFKRQRILRVEYSEADHTFSSRVWREQVTLQTEQWLRSW